MAVEGLPAGITDHRKSRNYKFLDDPDIIDSFRMSKKSDGILHQER
jgi:hypothetical protein